MQRKLRKSKIANEIDNSFDFEIYGETLEEAIKILRQRLLMGKKRNLCQMGNQGFHLKIASFHW